MGIKLFKTSIVFTTMFVLFGCVNLHAQQPQNVSIARTYLKLENIDQALLQYKLSIEDEQSKRKAGSGVCGEVLAEYAYVLALHHDFEAALVNIDRTRALGTKYGNFYAAQILMLLCYYEPARHLMGIDSSQNALTLKDSPEWINGVYQKLNNKYSTRFSVIRNTPNDALSRANRLAANGQTIQAIAIFEELSVLYPNAYIVDIDHSTIWENMKKYDYAIALLQKGIDKVPQDSVYSEYKKVFQDHLEEVKSKKKDIEQYPLHAKVIRMPRMMTYVGLSKTKDIFSLNGRFGLCTQNKFSASFNLGLGWFNDSYTGNIGISAYKSWKIFVFGIGISDQFTETTTSFGLSPSIGLSFMNKAQTSSFDINLGWIFPFDENQKSSWNLSIGTTIYTDVKKK